MKRLKLRNTFMIAALAVAGLFGASTAFFNVSANNQTHMRNALAAEANVTPDYIYLRTDITKTDTWYDSMMGNTTCTFYGPSPTIGYAEELGEPFPGDTVDGTVDVGSKKIARFLLTKSSKLDHVLFTCGETDQTYKKTGDKKVQTLLDTYILDTQGTGTWGMGSNSSGYWSKQVYVDISGTSWPATTSQLQIRFYRNSDYTEWVSMQATSYHASGESYSNAMAYGIVPKEGSSDIMDHIPEIAQIRVSGSDYSGYTTGDFYLKHNSNYVYKIGGPDGDSNRSVQAISLDNKTVTFNTGGIGTPAPQDVPYGTTDVIEPTPTADGYEFEGYWYSNAGKSEYYDFENDVVRGPVTIYGTMNPITYSISYNYNGGSDPENEDSYNIESGDITLINPTKTGYTFTGWTGSNGSTPQTTVTIPTGSFGDKSYTANYSINYYTITWRNYNGTILKQGSYAYGTDISGEYDGPTPEKPQSGSTFYNFTGWSPSFATVSADADYTAQFSENLTKARLYIDLNWNSNGPYVGATFGSGNQDAASASINANESGHIPASGNSVVTTSYYSVADVSLPASGQDSIYFTYYQNENIQDHAWTRWIAWKNGMDQEKGTWNGMINGLMQDKVNNQKVNFNNGYIYYVKNFSSEGTTYECKVGYSDRYDSSEDLRWLKWFTYNLSCVGVFVHYDLNGAESENPSFVPDIEHKLKADLTLPSAPTRSGYTFMGWEASNTGIVTKAGGTYDGLDEPISFRAIWHSNTIQAISSDKTRVWVGYNINGDYLSSLMHYGLDYTCRLWLHKGNGSSGGEEDVIAPTGTYYNLNEKINNTYADCPRRYDYYDVPKKYFDNGWYMHAQRFNASGLYDGSTTSNQVTLASSDNYAFKVFYISNDGSTWYFTSISEAYGLSSPDAMFAAISLAGMRSCSNEKMNGTGGYSNWSSTFLQTTSPSDLSAYTIVDYASFDTDYEGPVNNPVNAYHKYNIIQSQVSGGRVLSLGYLNGLFGQGEESPVTLIIIIASSISLLSITALSVLVIKKRKTKEQ